MNTVKVLIEGYAKESEKGWVASSTTVFIESNGKKIIVDPGTNRELLLEKLKEENLVPENIDYVFMTHTHADHILLCGMFPRAKFVDDSTIYDNDIEIEHEGIIPETEVKIISTPGHDQFHTSLVVPTEKGKVVVAGDVFWWSDSEEQKTDKESLLNHEDTFEKNHEQLIKSRNELLAMADFIIPGHGKEFRVN